MHFRRLSLARQRRAVTDACTALGVDILYRGRGLSVKEHAARARERFAANDFEGAREDAKAVLDEQYSASMSELLAKSLCSTGQVDAGLAMAKRMAKIHAMAVREHCDK